MKFLLDMGISPSCAHFLHGRGFEAVHLEQIGRARLRDPQILEMARRDGLVLVTHDLDFGELVAASGGVLPSVVLFRLRNMRPENVNRYLGAVVDEAQAALAEGAFVTVRELSIRVRSLPFEGG